MAQRIHFQDDIFFVHRIVQIVSDSSRIDIDPELFADRVMTDVRYADMTIKRLKGLLLANTRVSESAEYLKLLCITSATLAEAASDLSSGKSDISAAIAQHRDELLTVFQSQRAIVSEIRDLIADILESENLDTDVVSRDELSELLQS